MSRKGKLHLDLLLSYRCPEWICIPFLNQLISLTGCPRTAQSNTAGLLRSTVCLAGVTLVSRGDLTVRSTSILCAPNVLFITQTYRPVSSTKRSNKMSTSKWYLTLVDGNTCLKPEVGVVAPLSWRNHLKDHVEIIIKWKCCAFEQLKEAQQTEPRGYI